MLRAVPMNLMTSYEYHFILFVMVQAYQSIICGIYKTHITRQQTERQSLN